MHFQKIHNNTPERFPGGAELRSEKGGLGSRARGDGETGFSLSLSQVSPPHLSWYLGSHEGFVVTTGGFCNSHTVISLEGAGGQGLRKTVTKIF